MCIPFNDFDCGPNSTGADLVCLPGNGGSVRTVGRQQ